MPNTAALLAGLDPQQRAAAEALRGPVCIIAAAGSGKTTTISHRIALGIEQGYFAANRVLALSYTNRAATAIRLKLRELGAGDVAVRTFHSAALAQLQFFWPQLTDTQAPRLLASKYEIVGEALRAAGSQIAASAFVNELEWQKYTLTDDQQYLAAGRPFDADEYLAVRAIYERLKLERMLIDWEDVLLVALGMVHSEPRVSEYLRSQYRFFTVDEYQDISPLQQALLEAWVGDRAELCVVGDPRQTIYSFAGARSSFLTSFESRFEDATIVELNRNYRSSPEIVEFSKRILSDDSIESIQASGLPVAIEQVTNAPERIADLIAEELAAGVSESDIAVLTRINSQLEPISAALTQRGIKVQARGTGMFFKRPEVTQAYALLRALQTQSDSADPLFVRVSAALTSIGWVSQPQPSDSWRALNWFIEVLDELGDEASLDAYLRELDERQRSQHEPTLQAVTLATVHSAKGLEWQSVYLPSVNEGSYPIFQARSEAEIAEERRLFYVAATRAKRQLRLFVDSAKPASRFLPR
jgi:DNA helicase-2/ATP-dependent DNA helicase PcrA